MRVRDLLAPGAPRLRLLAAEDELDRQVSGVMTTDLYDPGRYLHGGELVLTGMLWRTGPEDSERFVRTLAAGGAVALAAGEAEVGPIPEDLIEACRRHRMPLLAVPDDIAFSTLTEFIGRQVSADRAADLAALVDRHRMLVSAAGGGGLHAVLDLLGGDLDLDCWVLTPTGRVVAGPAEHLSAEDRDQLVRAHLAAQRQRRRPRTGPAWSPAPTRCCPRPRTPRRRRRWPTGCSPSPATSPSGPPSASSSPRTWPGWWPPSATGATRADGCAAGWPTRC